MADFRKLIESMNQILEGSWEDDEAADRAAFDMQPKTNMCPDCEGGRYDPEGECETCGGAGEIFEDGIEEGRDVREMTNKIYHAMDDEILNPRDVAEACMSYMSESNVAEMARMNGFFEYENDEDEDDDEFESVERDDEWGEVVEPLDDISDPMDYDDEDKYDLGEDPWGLGQ